VKTLQIPQSHSIKVYVTVRCFNLAGDESHAVSDGLVIEHKPPTVDDAQLTISTPSLTHFPPRDGHGVFRAERTSVFVHWSGFKDAFNKINEYQVCLKRDIR
jgi:hypothetical protein